MAVSMVRPSKAWAELLTVRRTPEMAAADELIDRDSPELLEEAIRLDIKALMQRLIESIRLRQGSVRSLKCPGCEARELADTGEDHRA